MRKTKTVGNANKCNARHLTDHKNVIINYITIKLHRFKIHFVDTEKDLLFETIDKKMIHFINNYIEMASNIELNVIF